MQAFGTLYQNLVRNFDCPPSGCQAWHMVRDHLFCCCRGQAQLAWHRPQGQGSCLWQV